MIIKCLSTGSKGNCYSITNSNNEVLLIELGIPFEKIITQIDNIDKISGVLISHKHKDHNFNDNDTKFINSGISVYSPSLSNCEIGKKYSLNGFEFIPLPCKHNVPCFGYLIRCDNKTILFATDTRELPKVNMPIDVFLIEINHIYSWVEKIINEMDYQDSKFNYEARSVYTHHSVESCKEYFSNLGYIPSIILGIHHSYNQEHFSKDYAFENLSQIADYFDIVEDNDEFEI